MLGQQIKKLRKENRMTQEEFGRTLSHTKSTISKWENNSSHPDIATLKRISEIFGVKLDTLVSDVSNIKKTNLKDKLVFTWNKCNYSGIKEMPVRGLWRYLKILFSLLILGSLLMTFLPLVIAQDNYGKKEILYLVAGIVLFTIFIIALTVVVRISGKLAMTKRFNVIGKIFSKKIIIENKITHKTKTVISSDIKNVKREVYKDNVKVSVVLKSEKTLSLFMVDDSVYANIKDIWEGGKND